MVPVVVLLLGAFTTTSAFAYTQIQQAITQSNDCTSGSCTNTGSNTVTINGHTTTQSSICIGSGTCIAIQHVSHHHR